MATVNSVPVNFVANTCRSDAFDLAPYSGAGVVVGATWTTCMLGFAASPTQHGTYVLVVDNSLKAVGIPSLPSMFIPIPDNIVGSTRWVRLVSHSAGNAINQAATQVTVLRKEV